MNKLEKLELRFQNIVAKINVNNFNDIDKDLNRVVLALNDLKNNACGCGETMRIKVVEDLISNIEARFINK